MSRVHSSGPEPANLQPVLAQLREDVRIPLEIEFPHAVVRDRKRAGARVCREILIGPLHDHQRPPIGGDNLNRQAQGPRLLDGLIASDDVAAPVREERPSRAVLRQRLRQGASPARRPAIRIFRIDVRSLIVATRAAGSVRAGLTARDRRDMALLLWPRRIVHRGQAVIKRDAARYTRSRVHITLQTWRRETEKRPERLGGGHLTQLTTQPP